MFAFIGIIAGVICVLLGFILHGGQFMVLVQPTEFIIIFGGAFGIFLGSNGVKVLKQSIKATTALLKPEPTKQQYIDLLKMMYQLFSVARKEGLLGLESHVEYPEKSNIVSKYPSFMGNHHAVAFFADTMKVVLTGAVGPHDLSEMMEIDLETAHQEESLPGEAMQNVADAMPAMGIVAAVLGVIMTMSKIGGDAGVIGGKQDGYDLGLVWNPTDYLRFLLSYGHVVYSDAVIPAAGGDRDYSVDALGMRAQIDF